MKLSRTTFIYFFASLIGAFGVVFFYNQAPSYTDSYYHYNGAVNLATGRGFVEDYLWVYIAAPDSLPAPSHLYWMPGTSIVSAVGMLLAGTNYTGARIGLALCLWGAMLLAYWLGLKLGKTQRHAWLAGILTLFAGFFTDTWGQTDTFAPYAFFGSAALILMGIGISAEKQNWRYWIVAGLFAGAGHLIRTDGLLLLLVGWIVLLYPFERSRYREHLVWLLPFTIGYLLVMGFWFARNYAEIGTILPTGGTQNVWFRNYDELFNYPPDASPATLFANGIGDFVNSRLWATFSTNGILFQAIAYEGVIVFFPFILLGLWNRRKEAFWRGILWFAIGIHIAFAWVFTFAGVRGGFWHASAALVPIWAITGLLGLEDAIHWLGKRRPSWNPRTAIPLFSYSLVGMVVIISIMLSVAAIDSRPELLNVLENTIPANSRLMSSDPSEIYYFTGIGGIPIPNESPEIALQLAELYEVDYLILQDGSITEPMKFEISPDFLREIPLNLSGVRLYAFERD